MYNETNLTMDQMFSNPDFRKTMYGRLIQAVRETKDRISEVVGKDELRVKGLMACDRLIHGYRKGITDWVPGYQKTHLEPLELAYEDIQLKLFSDS